MSAAQVAKSQEGSASSCVYFTVSSADELDQIGRNRVRRRRVGNDLVQCRVAVRLHFRVAFYVDNRKLRTRRANEATGRKESCKNEKSGSWHP